MTDATKASILLGVLALAVAVSVGVAIHESRGRAAAQVEAKKQEGRADAAGEREAQAKTAKAAAEQLAARALGEVARLKAVAAQHPAPPAAQPVPPDATADLVVAGLRDLGLRPGLLGAPAAPDLALPLSIGLTLPDSRTALAWGHEAQRVPPLSERIAALEQLAQAQEGATSALLQRAEAADQATAAADTRADAEHRRAEALQRAVDLNPLRHWAPGVLVGVDDTGTRRVGAYLQWSSGPIHAEVVVLNNTVAIGGGIRF